MITSGTRKKSGQPDDAGQDEDARRRAARGERRGGRPADAHRDAPAARPAHDRELVPALGVLVEVGAEVEQLDQLVERLAWSG